MLTLIRHSQVTKDPTISSHQWRLSANGRSRAHQLASQIVHSPARIYTSTEAKAQETGQILAAEWGISSEPVAGLQEHNRQGVPYFPSFADFQAKIADFFARPTHLGFGQETAVQALVRYKTAVDLLVNQSGNESIAIVSHGTVMTLFITHFNPEIDPLTFWQQLTLPDYYHLNLPDYQLRQSD